MIDPAYLKKIAAELPNLPWLELVAAADEIIALRSKLHEQEIQRSLDQKLIDAEQGRIIELVGRLHEAEKSAEDIAAQLGVTAPTIHQDMKLLDGE